jgi:8-oxo-dGTP pyrophosphatase MutT (NUDIX family)
MTPAGASSVAIAKIERVDVAVEPWTWEFATARRDEIDGNFTRRQQERPTLWNGRVILLHRYTIGDGALRGACFETDYASFLAWRDWNFPDPGVFNIFGSAALQSADGAFLVGEMAPTTASAGQVYFPCGTPDPDDLGAGGALDLDGSVRRELEEETGLEIGALDATPGWTMVHDRGYLGLMKRLKARQSADELRARIMDIIAGQPRPEFCDIRIVRSRADLDPRMPRFMVAYLEDAWRQDTR